MSVSIQQGSDCLVLCEVLEHDGIHQQIYLLLARIISYKTQIKNRKEGRGSGGPDLTVFLPLNGHYVPSLS